MCKTGSGQFNTHFWLNPAAKLLFILALKSTTLTLFYEGSERMAQFETPFYWYNMD